MGEEKQVIPTTLEEAKAYFDKHLDYGYAACWVIPKGESILGRGAAEEDMIGGCDEEDDRFGPFTLEQFLKYLGIRC